jgi:hypothetical protein
MTTTAAPESATPPAINAEDELLGVVLTPRQIWELLDLINDSPGDADEDVLDAIATKLRAPRVFTRVSAARYQGRLLALSAEEHASVMALVEDDATPSPEIIDNVAARLVALVPDRGRGSRHPD